MDWKNSVSKESLLYSTEFICTFVKLNGIEEGKFFSRSRSSIRCAKEWGAVKSKKKKGKNKTKRKGRKEKGKKKKNKKEEQKMVCKVTINGRSDTLALVFALDHRSTRKEMTRDLRPIQIRRKRKPSKFTFSIVLRYTWDCTVISWRL